MGNQQDGGDPANEHAQADPTSLEGQLRHAAYQTWATSRGDWQDRTEALFDRAYLGHYSHIDHYVETLVDNYQLDAKLDTAISAPFREFVDIDISGLSRSLVRNGTLYTIPAAPVGVWVFNGEIG